MMGWGCRREIYLDKKIYVPEREVAVIEQNKDIFVREGITVDGTLMIRDCRVFYGEDGYNGCIRSERGCGCIIFQNVIFGCKGHTYMDDNSDSYFCCVNGNFVMKDCELEGCGMFLQAYGLGYIELYHLWLENSKRLFYVKKDSATTLRIGEWCVFNSSIQHFPLLTLEEQGKIIRWMQLWR